jgi:hypothetical protein
VRHGEHFLNNVLRDWGIADKLPEMALEPFETAEAQGAPTVQQQSVFIENRVGQLLRLTQLFDRTDIRILAISVVHSVDCAICRLLLDDPDKAYEVLSNARFSVSETELLAVGLPHGKRGLLGTWAALLGAEVNVYYTYPLLIRPKGAGAIAVCPDNIELAATVLRERNFELLDQQALLDARNE